MINATNFNVPNSADSDLGSPHPLYKRLANGLARKPMSQPTTQKSKRTRHSVWHQVTVLLFFSLWAFPAWNQLQAAKLVLIVEDENAKPVPGMEVIHTDKNGDKATGTYDETAGVYRFGDLVDGAGSVTAFKRNYRLAGVRWFLHTPDTVHIVSVKGGHLWYKESDRNIWFKTSNRLLQIGYTYAETETPNAEEIISNAGFVRTKKGSYKLRHWKKIHPFLTPELAIVEKEIQQVYIGLHYRITKPHGIPVKNGQYSIRSSDYNISNNLELCINLRARTQDEWLHKVDSLMTQYGLVLDESAFGYPVTLEDAMYNLGNGFYVVCKSGMGACITDQMRFMLDCPYILRCEFTHSNIIEFF